MTTAVPQTDGHEVLATVAFIREHYDEMFRKLSSRELAERTTRSWAGLVLDVNGPASLDQQISVVGCDTREFIVRAVQQAIEEAVAAERERCVRIAAEVLGCDGKELLGIVSANQPVAREDS